jgi:hypothetical protein
VVGGLGLANGPEPVFKIQIFGFLGVYTFLALASLLSVLIC